MSFIMLLFAEHSLLFAYMGFVAFGYSFAVSIYNSLWTA